LLFVRTSFSSPQTCIAFSSEVVSGSREENAQNEKRKASPRAVKKSGSRRYGQALLP
jgi:hypothetical protein